MSSDTEGGRGSAPSAPFETRSRRLFEVRQIVKHRGPSFTLGPFDLSLEPGQILGVMGPNGAGKTTLLRLIWGFQRPDDGSVTVFGRTAHLEQVWLRSRAGYVPESPSFYDWMSARDFLSFVSGFYPTWSWGRAELLMERLGLDSRAQVQALSKGNRAKLGLVAAVAHGPELLLLDEPTAGLDPIVRREVLNVLKLLAVQDRTGIVLASHVSDDLDRIADQILMLDEGRRIEHDDAETLLVRYRSAKLEDVFLSAVGRFRTVGRAHCP